MTNEQKIKAYLESGHYVKVNLLIDDSIITELELQLVQIRKDLESLKK